MYGHKHSERPAEVMPGPAAAARGEGCGPAHFKFGPHGPGFGRGHGTAAAPGRAPAAATCAPPSCCVLADEPMHGYQIMQRLEERSGGAWRPSPGSVYPTLQLLEDQGIDQGRGGRGPARVLADRGRQGRGGRGDQGAPRRFAVRRRGRRAGPALRAAPGGLLARRRGQAGRHDRARPTTSRRRSRSLRDARKTPLRAARRRRVSRMAGA